MENETSACPICGYLLNTDHYWYQSDGDRFRFNCNHCGEFKISGWRMKGHFFPHDNNQRPAPDIALSIALRHLYEDTGVISEILKIEDIDRIKQSVRIPNSPLELIDVLLLFLHKRTNQIGSKVRVTPTDHPMLYIKNQNELQALIQFAKERGYIYSQHVSNSDEYTLKLELSGWDRLDKLTSGLTKTKQVFIAMKFGDGDLDEVYNTAIAPAVVETGFNPFRIDREEHNDKICDLVLAEIKRSDFIIADFTFQRGGVYFEAGYALGLGKPVIWCCKDSDKNNLHFDTRQYNHILWVSNTNLKEQLINRIRATINDPGGYHEVST
ncbi:MAG TPA: nucleoside 2-deoxyribosyltransferase [Candidatus Cloacimonadota bacterium]|nr:nucleoside 2-deoxyribosyltransferase [Candidatus Cloacimonadota bacterium]